LSSIRARTVVTVLSILAFIVSVIVFVWDKTKHHPAPIWDVGLLAYGGVFCVVLWMDSIGNHASRLRLESDARKRPTPRPMPRPLPKATSPSEQQAVPLGVVIATSEPDVSLLRVSPDETELLLQLADRAVKEMMALDDEVPRLDESGHAAVIQEEQWLSRTNVYCFFILLHEDRVGCCVLDVERGAQIRLLYVEPRMRQRGVGSLALKKLTEFIRMLGISSTIEARVSSSNVRAQRFLETCGFRKFEQMSWMTTSAQSKDGQDSRASAATKDWQTLHFVMTLGEHTS
jgi:GNAT superfamily N-acetyltransferase